MFHKKHDNSRKSNQKKRKSQYKKRKPHESLFEPKANWNDVRKFCIVDIIEIVIDQEYFIIDQDEKRS